MRTGFAENPGHKGEYCNTGLCVTISHRDTQRKILINRKLLTSNHLRFTKTLVHQKQPSYFDYINIIHLVNLSRKGSYVLKNYLIILS
jgi:hypothetical protein